MQGEIRESSFRQLTRPPAFGALTFDVEERRRDMAPGIRLLRLESALHWARLETVWPLTFGLACCAVEMLAAAGTPLETAPSGETILAENPRQADLMILSGRLDGRMAHYVRCLVDRMAAPRRVIGIGACLQESARHFGLPIDLQVEGCPPSPARLFEAIENLRRRENILEKRATWERPRAEKMIGEMEAT